MILAPLLLLCLPQQVAGRNFSFEKNRIDSPESDSIYFDPAVNPFICFNREVKIPYAFTGIPATDFILPQKSSRQVNNSSNSNLNIFWYLLAILSGFLIWIVPTFIPSRYDSQMTPDLCNYLGDIY
jgi:hypothetical protein